MKCYIVYRIEPLTRKQLLRCVKGTNTKPIFVTSWRWLASLVTWLVQADFYAESHASQLSCDGEVLITYTIPEEVMVP